MKLRSESLELRELQKPLLDGQAEITPKERLIDVLLVRLDHRIALERRVKPWFHE
jgi:hypothetical protein